MVGAFSEPSSGRAVPPIHSIPSSVAQALGEELYKLLLYNTRTVPPFQSDEDSIPYTKRQLLDAYMELKKQYEDLEMRCLFESEKARDDHIHYLRQNLIDFEHAVEPLAKKKPDTPMSRRQIQQIEALLRELRDLFHGAEGDEYLLPAEEAPDGDAAQSAFSKSVAVHIRS